MTSVFPRRDKSGQFENLRKIIFTYECPVYLSKNDCVWAKNRPKVKPVPKFGV
jgi:hypothetical protein